MSFSPADQADAREASQQRATQGLADLLVEAISPALVTLIVGSLVCFPVEVLYQGDFNGRLQYILCLFVMGTVCIARISMQEGSAYASMFAAPLAMVTALAMFRFVDFGGALSGIGPIVSLGLMALIWWCTHQLTVDSTLLERQQDSSGRGLLNQLGWESKAQTATTAKSDAEEKLEDAVSERTDRATAEKKRSWWEEWLHPENQLHAHGMWAFYFTVAAVPIFGIGQFFLDSSDLAARRWTFQLLVVYVAASLALLLATSFLGLRRYLKKRKLELPLQMAANWLILGSVLIGALLLTAFLLPRPAPEYSLAQLLPKITSPVRQSSPWGTGSEGVQDQPNPQQAGTGQKSEQEQSSTQQQAGSTDAASGDGQQSSSGQQGNDPQANSGQQQNSANQSQAGASNQQDGSSSQQQDSSGKQSGGQGSQSENSGSQQENTDSKSPDSQQSNAEKKQGSEGSASDAQSKDGQPERENSQQNGNNGSGNSQPERMTADSPPPAPPPTPGAATWSLAWLGDVLNWLGMLLMLGVAAFVGWKYREQIWEAIQKFRAAWLEWWARMFGGQPVAVVAASAPVAEPPPPPRSFASFADPFATGDAQRWPLVQLVRHSFAALEAWGREQACSRNVEQTPAEYAQTLAEQQPGVASEVRQLAQLYNQIAYGSGVSAKAAQPILQRFWLRMRGKEQG